MANDIASSMGAAIMLLAIAVLSAGVRKDQGRESWFLKSAAVALVSWQLIFCITVVAVWTCPAVKGHHLFGSPSVIILLLVISCFFELFISIPLPFLVRNFFFFIVTTIFVGVEFSNPSLDATKMEGLAALFAIPQSAFLVNWV